MVYVEYVVVGLLIATSVVYAGLRIRRALRGEGGCAFMNGGGGAGCGSCGGCSFEKKVDGEPGNPSSEK